MSDPETVLLFLTGTRGTQVHLTPSQTSAEDLTAALNGVLRKLRQDLGSDLRLVDADGVELTVENIAVNKVSPVFVLPAEGEYEPGTLRREGVQVTSTEDLYVNERGKVLLQRPEKPALSSVPKPHDSTYKPRSQLEFVQMMNSNRDPLNRGSAPLLSVTLSELSQHTSPEDAWVALYGKVYDMTKYVTCHPGGNVIMQAAGKDGTELFRKFHPWVNVDALIGKLQVGVLKSGSSYFLRP